jgi:hypothetical protein
MLFPYCNRPSFTSTQNNKKNYISYTSNGTLKDGEGKFRIESSGGEQRRRPRLT